MNRSVNTNDGNKKEKPFCIKQLGIDLKLSTDACSFQNKCRFSHIKIPTTCSTDWKKKLKDRVQGTPMIKNKQDYTTAIDGL